MKTKKILMTTEKLIEKIDNCKSDERLYVIYYDVVKKKIMEDRELMSSIAGNDPCFKCEDNIVFLRDAPIVIYKALLKHIRKYENDSYLINRLLPQRLVDLKNKIEYYSDEDEAIKIIKEMKL